MAYKGDGSRNRGAGRKDSNPGAMGGDRNGGGGGEKSAGGVTITRKKKGVSNLFDYQNPNPTPYDDGTAGPLISGTQEEIDKELNALDKMTPKQRADYNAASYSKDTQSTLGANGPTAWDFLDYLVGPLWNDTQVLPSKPETYAAGQWHGTYNPGGILGLAAGAASGIPGLSLVGSGLYNALGFEEPSWGSLYDTPAPTPQTAANPDVQPGGGITPGPVARSRSQDNPRLSGYSGGGYNMGSFGKKPSKKSNYLTQQLMAP